MKVKEESEKVGLKLNIQKSKIMASGPSTSWQIDGETVSDFILGGSKITAVVTAVMKLKDTPWKESYDQPRQLWCWRRLESPWTATLRLLLNHKRRQDSWPPEKKNSIGGQKRGLITQNFCVIKFIKV